MAKLQNSLKLMECGGPSRPETSLMKVWMDSSLAGSCSFLMAALSSSSVTLPLRSRSRSLNRRFRAASP